MLLLHAADDVLDRPRCCCRDAVKMQVARADAQKGEIVKQHSCQQDLHKVIEDPQKKHRIIVSTAADNKAKIEGAESENTRLKGQLAAAEKAFAETVSARDTLKTELGAHHAFSARPPSVASCC
jgi:hypothetical protein